MSESFTLKIESVYDIIVQSRKTDDLMNKFEAAQKYFGYKTFREGQGEVIDALLNGRDVMCVMPTGAGKSLCYQIPALILDGVTVVVSPLISLMKDQVGALAEMNIRAAYINSTLSAVEYDTALSLAADGYYKIIYVAPERLAAPDFKAASTIMNITSLIVDEAHCVSQWGQDFRPDYLKIAEFTASLPKRPVIGAFTATATADVRRDIINSLKLNTPFELTTGFDRPNLRFSVDTPPSRKEALLKFINAHKNDCGIVYCSTRKNVEDICSYLCEHGFDAIRYHAGLSEKERVKNQDDFIYDAKKIVVATNAFGMGIDKSNVAYVVHYNMPKNIESYYQEAGRAGRDGSSAECLLLYSPSDVYTARFLIEHTEQNTDTDDSTRQILHSRESERLKAMTLYCTTDECLRAFMLQYFGENYNKSCGNCSNCLNEGVRIDITVASQKILSCVARINGRYGINLIIDIMRGMKSERIASLGLDKLSTYGLLSDNSEGEVRAMINRLLNTGCLNLSDSEYPVLSLGKSAHGILFDGVKIDMKEFRKPSSNKKQKSVSAKKSSKDDSKSVLFEQLRTLRADIAKQSGIPAYIVFSDATLHDMCAKLPRTYNEFLSVSGVGQVKAEKYGAAFVYLISIYIK